MCPNIFYVQKKSRGSSVIHNLKFETSSAVTFTNWEKIDKAETEAGEKIGKPREKIVDIQQMIKVASA